MVKNSKIIINIETETKEKLKRKASELNISLASFVKLVLSHSLKVNLFREE